MTDTAQEMVARLARIKERWRYSSDVTALDVGFMLDIIASQAARIAELEGDATMVLVPREPTLAMSAMGLQEIEQHWPSISSMVGASVVSNVYSAMIAAAIRKETA